MTRERPKEGNRASRVYLGVAYRMACLGVFKVFGVLVSGAVMAGLCGCTITVHSGPASPANGYVAAPAPQPPTVVYVPVAQPGHVPANPGAVPPPASAASGRRAAAPPAGPATGRPSQLPSNLPVARAPAAPATPAPAAPSSPSTPVAHLPLPSPALLRPPAAPVAPPAATPTPPATSSTPDANAPVPARKGNPRAVKQPESAPTAK